MAALRALFRPVDACSVPFRNGSTQRREQSGSGWRPGGREGALARRLRDGLELRLSGESRIER